MTKEQIQEAAEREYPHPMPEFKDLWTREKHQAYHSGFRAAMNSDTVKGMAEALEQVERGQYGELKGDFIIRIRKLASAALHNYNDSIK